MQVSLLKEKIQSFSTSYFELLKGMNSSIFILFGPSIFFLLLALAVLAAPTLVIALAASFFSFLSFVSAFLAWKYIELKKRIKENIDKVQNTVQVQAVQIPVRLVQEGVIIEDKKIIIH